MANARTDFFVPPFEMRCVWPHVSAKRTTDWENKPLALADQYYDASFFFPKTAASPWECRSYMFLANMLEPIIRETWPGGWPGVGPNGNVVNWPIADCDLSQPIPPQVGRPMPRSVSPDYMEKYPWARGHWRFTVTSEFPPQMADALNNPIQKNLSGEFIGFKSGDYIYASINAYAYVKGSGGISFGFQGIKKTRDGEPVGGGGQSIEQMFGPSQGSSAGAYGQPSQQAAPPLPAGYGAPQPQYGAPNPTPAPTGYPTSGGAPSYAPPAGYPQQGQPYAAPPPPSTTNGVYPSSPHPSAPLAYGAPPGQPVAPPAYGAPPSPGYGAPPPIGTR